MREQLANIDDQEVLIVGGFFLTGLATWAMLKRYGCEPLIAEHLEYFSKSICSAFGDTEHYEVPGSRKEYLEQDSDDIASCMEQGTLNLSSHRYSLHKSFSTGELPEKDDEQLILKPSS